MIKPDMIPDKVARGAAYAFYNADTGLGIVDDWKTAIAAALNAWPSAAVCHYTIADNEGYEMVLPLPFPQDAGDE